jgi:hypothetical protein
MKAVWYGWPKVDASQRRGTSGQGKILAVIPMKMGIQRFALNKKKQIHGVSGFLRTQE